MTSSGTTKYKTSASNLYNRHQGDYNSTSGNYSSSRRPQRTSTTNVNHNHHHSRKFGDDQDTDGDDKRLLTLSERIKKLSSSKVLKDNSLLTHNNNEPFTYLRSPTERKSLGVNSSSKVHQNQKFSGLTTSTKKPGREVIYAQVVVDPEDRNPKNPSSAFSNNHTKHKRTVHRSYNNKNYDSGHSGPLHTGVSGSGGGGGGSKMRGRNVTTVLLNSSSDDIPSSLNIDEKFGTDTRFRSSSSPLLASNDDYYPKSPGIVKHLQNGYNSGSRYESNNLQRSSTDYFHLNQHPSDDDEYFGRNKYSYKYGNSSREKSPFGRDDSDDLYNYQPIHYSGGVGKSASTNFIDTYTSNKTFRDRLRDESTNYRIEEEDEYDVTRNTKFEERRSKTLDRDGGFGGYNSKNRLSSADFIQRSKTLDNRLSTLRQKSMLNENKGRDDNFEDSYDFKVTTKTKQENNTSKNATSTQKKEKTTSGTNIFSTLLRRNQKQPNSSTKENIQLGNHKVVAENNKKAEKKIGQNTNFFTSFLEKKRKKQQISADLKKSKEQPLKVDNSSTYQSYSDWPPPAPPALNVVDYSDVPPTPISKTYYGESNIDTEDSNAHGSDIWKKSYGSDLKLKRRWTMKEPAKPNVIREEEDLTSRTLGRKTSTYLGTSSIGVNNNQSIDRRRNRTYSTDRDEGYNRNNNKYYDQSDSFLQVPGTTKYNTIDSRYSTDKISYKPQTYDDFEPSRSSYNTLNRRGKLKTSSDKLNKGYAYGGGFVGGGTPNSSGSESNNRNTTTTTSNNLVNGSLRSVFLHEPAVIPEMPRTTTSSNGGGGGGASISGLSGRRTLSKDEISNYSGPRKETKQLSRSLSMAHPWSPNKSYKEKYRELDYSQSNNLHLPPRPPSRSPSGSAGLNSRQSVHKSGESPVKRSPSKIISPTKTRTPSTLSSSTRNLRKPTVNSSSVESLLRQDTPGPDENAKKKSSTKLGRSKSISVPQSTTKDGKVNRFSTLWFNKRNANK